MRWCLCPSAKQCKTPPIVASVEAKATPPIKPRETTNEPGPFKAVSRKKKSKPKPKAKSRKGKEKAGEEVEDVEEEEEERQELWCICNQVFVGSGHGVNCVVAIHQVSFISKGRVLGGFFFACVQHLSIWLRFFRWNFCLIINFFNFFPGFFNGLHTFLHV